MTIRIARLGRQMVMQDVDGERLVGVDDLMRPIAHHYGITLAELKGRCRKADLVEARVAAIRTLDSLGFSRADIARALHRDHSTILYHLRNGERLSTP